MLPLLINLLPVNKLCQHESDVTYVEKRRLNGVCVYVDQWSVDGHSAAAIELLQLWHHLAVLCVLDLISVAETS